MFVLKRFTSGQYVFGLGTQPIPISVENNVTTWISESKVRTATGGEITAYEAAHPTESSPGGSSVVSVYSPDIPYATPSTEDDEFNTGSLDAKWSVFGTTPSPTFVIPSMVRLFADNYGVGAGIVQDVEDATAKWRCKIHPPRDNVTSKQCGFVAKANGSNQAKAYFVEWTNMQLQVFNYANYITGSGSGAQVGTLAGTSSDVYPLYMELSYNAGTNLLIYSISRDGVAFNQVDSSVLSGGLDKIGIHCMGGGSHRFDVDWFRKLQGSATGI